MSDAHDNLERVRRSPLFRWAQYSQWLGLIFGLTAIGLAVFTPLTQTAQGIGLIAVLGMLGVLILVPARFILTLHLMQREQKR